MTHQTGILKVDVTIPEKSRDQDADKASNTAIRLLSRREHTTLELRRKLKGRGIDDAIINMVIEQLNHDRLLSDERFTENYVRMRMNKGYGPMRIRAELKERGVADNLIARYLAYDEEVWVEQAVDAREKKFGAESPVDIKNYNRQARFLQQRGFNTGIVRKILGNYYT